MRILAIGDPHGSKKVKRIPTKEIDLILITGDIGKADLARKLAFKNIERKKKGLPEIEPSKKLKKKIYKEVYLSSLDIVKYLSKIAPVYLIYGNVEPESSKDKEEWKKVGVPFLTDSLKKIKNVRIINNRIANFNGIRVGGLQYFIDTSWIREFKPSDYKKRLKEAKKETDKAKRVLKKFKELDILLCHQPPYGILDKVTSKAAPKHWKGKHAGSKTILDYIKRQHPKYVFCGHIHEAKGNKKIGKTRIYNLGAGDYVVIDI